MSILDDEYTQAVPGDESGLRMSSRLKATWVTTGKWAFFLSVLGFLGVGLFVLLLIAVGSVIKSYVGLLSAQYPAMRVIEPLLGYLTVIMIPVTALFFFIFFYHIRFAGTIQKALRYNDQELFTAAWRNLRNYFRIYGIVMILLIIFYLIVMILALGLESAVEPVMLPPGE